MNPIPYTLTNESITVVVSGIPRTFQKGSVSFNQLRAACLEERWNDVSEVLTPKDAMKVWLKESDFCVDLDGKIRFGTEEVLPENMQNRMRKMADAGEDPLPIAFFYGRLQKNPSSRSVSQLFDFLSHSGIPIEPSGTFLAYKGVKDDLTDCRTGTVDNTPGTVNQMPRNKISDDPREACHFGFHVGALGYAGPFGTRVVICRVDPADVVCVPYDCSSQKMRVCKYEVIGFHASDKASDPMPSTTYEVDTGGEESWVGEEPDEPEEGLTPCYFCKKPTDESFFCHGCKTVVCNDCEETGVSGFTHDPEEHNPDYAGDFDLQASSSLPKPARRGKNRASLFNKMGAKDLMAQTIDDLRAYATKGLKIVGASKLPGGKTTLISRIVRVRRRK